MNRLIKKAVIGALTYLGILLTALPFLAVYHLGHQPTLLLYALLVCLVSIVSPRIRYSLPFYFIGWLVTLYRFFPYGESFSFTWFVRYFDDLLTAVSEILAGRVGYITEIVAVTIIVTSILLLAVCSIYLQRFSLVYGGMAVYLLTVVIFNDFNLTWHLLGVCFCGVLCSLIKTQQLKTIREWRFWLGLTLLCAFLLVGGSLLPKTGIRDRLVAATTGIRTQANQIGFYRFVEEYGAPSGSRTGFSENDRQLGGPLLDDDTVLFTARQETRHYWRVESKDFYSGKGWINTQREEDLRTDPHSLKIADSSYQQPYLEMTNIQLYLANQGDYLPLPYGSSEITIEEGATGFIVDDAVQRVDLMEPQQQIEISLAWQPAEYAAEALQSLPLQQPDTPVDYTQLPENLPERIPALARSITEEQDTVFEQVTAIENHLKNSIEFRYSKTDAVYPAEEQDYVDQFLFESKVGYCDNFSSAMVVLLRTLDIPARWVKGFSPGDAQTENGLTTFTVRNRNAHSWAEVYFAGFGWVPFEPTPNFQNPDRPELPTTTVSSEEVPETSSSSLTSASSSETSPSTTSSSTVSSTEMQPATTETTQWLRYFLRGAACLIVLGLLYLLRRYFFRIRIWLICRFRPEPLATAYPLLLKQMTKVLFHADSEPLSEYARRLEAIYPIFHGSFVQLTESYEAYLYGGTLTTNQQQLILHVARQINQLKKISHVH
ncbi:transglutaminase domain-containing protein [Enterococcus sp.]|uniref:transglutaminase domain-containing protein n=1 Tax=Enterococcus sp. TaxID=35783 RepID=UPI0025C02228|nr:transglutaminase domain-containing protein [Enterococcus sp.]